MIANQGVRYPGADGEAGPIGLRDNRQPDAVIDSLTAASGRFMPGLASSLPAPGLNGMPTLTDPRIGMAEAKVMAVSALAETSPAWGAHMASMLNSDERFNGEEVAPGTFPRIMQVRAADLDDPGMNVLPDELRSERFNTDINRLPRAVIDFQHDQTLQSVIMMGHEAGHAIADDVQNINGLTHLDNPRQMVELQAYTIQHLVADQLCKSDDPAVANASRTLVTAQHRANLVDLSVGQLAHQAIEGLKTGGDPDASAMFKERFGEDWPQLRDQSAAAGKLFSAIEGHDYRALEELGTRVHGRAVQYLVGKGLADQLRSEAGPEQRQLYDTLMGAKPGQALPNVLAAAGVTNQATLDDFTSRSVAAIGDTLGIEPRENFSMKSTGEWRQSKEKAAAPHPMQQPVIERKKS